MIVDQEPAPMSAKDALAQIGYLRDLVEETRIRVADGYREFAMWGAVWLVGYGVTAWLERGGGGSARHIGSVWLGLIGLATAGHILLFRGYRRTEHRTTLGGRLLRVNLVVVFAFLFHPVLYDSFTLPSSGAYMAFWVGVAYVLNGIFIGREMVAIGGWFFVVSFVARMIDSPSTRSLWLALAGGGSLLLTSVIFYRQSRRNRQAA